MIYERLFAFFADKAFVSSMHRLHLLDQFDYIYILEKGKVVDEGSFDELIARNANFIRFEATNLP
jgi:ATP-binding cassette, subfamily B, bacterial